MMLFKMGTFFVRMLTCLTKAAQIWTFYVAFIVFSKKIHMYL